MGSLEKILKYLNEQRGLDFSGYRVTMLERRTQKRIFSTGCNDLEEYLEYLYNHSDELDNLIDVLTINVSSFFRNSLSFEFIRKIVIPDLFFTQAKQGNNNIRIWSAGCSFGEEPYSLTILINEYLEKEKASVKLNIFATDIDVKAIQRAIQGVYESKSLEDVKYGILKKYFTKEANRFWINSDIKNKIQFSFYDLLDTKHNVPPESIYGNFDLVMCRNVLIYFELNFQKEIFKKLYNSLKPGGYLVLGESEVPIDEFKCKFIRTNGCCKIYRKIGV